MRIVRRDVAVVVDVEPYFWAPDYADDVQQDRWLLDR
jgi:hypothetical protein